MAVLILSTVAGIHDPEIPLLDVVGKTGAASPWHIAGIAVKTGVCFGSTVTVIDSVALQL